ncbi:hypothetical protein [Pseudomonas sp. SC3(2021)]|uniref:hypothetical protein n=1 Tax=Pseudomonas sp. SC3(2021) TaxID=2871493 RepID=UPI0021C6B30F|nr:hypothetical protein [Pseudomonas sp. SC3(2021)]
MLGMELYFLFLFLTGLVLWYRKWYVIDHSSLLRQGFFWWAIIVPVLSFFYFGCFAWSGYSVSLDSEGFNEFVSISKLPMGLLSLSIPFVAIVVGVHRSIQTREQIEATTNQIAITKKKNSLDEYYAREKNFLDKCVFVEKRVGGLPVSMSSGSEEHPFSLSAPHKLFKKIYLDAKPEEVSIYESSDVLYWQIVNEIEMININLKSYMDRVEAKEDLGGEEGAVILFIIQKAICKVFDLLNVELFPVPYFYIKSPKGSFQLCVATEADLKVWLRKFLILVESFVGSVWPERKLEVFPIRRYVFLGAYFFRCYEFGEITQKYDALNWEQTVNPFK